jgi:hypothetical protein
MVAVERELPEAVIAEAPSVGADAIPLALRRRGGSARQVLAVTLIGAVVLAIFASRDLASWLDRMGTDPMLRPIQQAAAEWDRAMDRLGLTRPAEALRDFIRGALDRQW